jgi:hypothetical protein
VNPRKKSAVSDNNPAVPETDQSDGAYLKTLKLLQEDRTENENQ